MSGVFCMFQVQKCKVGWCRGAGAAVIGPRVAVEVVCVVIEWVVVDAAGGIVVAAAAVVVAGVLVAGAVMVAVVLAAAVVVASGRGRALVAAPRRRQNCSSCKRLSTSLRMRSGGST